MNQPVKMAITPFTGKSAGEKKNPNLKTDSVDLFFQ
jgi:hypothetical protein